MAEYTFRLRSLSCGGRVGSNPPGELLLPQVILEMSLSQELSVSHFRGAVQHCHRNSGRTNWSCGSISRFVLPSALIR
jgi:hypothetical protein